MVVAEKGFLNYVSANGAIGDLGKGITSANKSTSKYQRIPLGGLPLDAFPMPKKVGDWEDDDGLNF